jgi:uncharacterized protein (TIGR03067 family)
MKTKVLAALSLGALCVATSRADDVSKELETFTGSWAAAAVEHDGRKLPEGEVKTVKLTVRGEKYTFRVGDQVIEGTHKLDPGKKPKQIDAVRSKGPDAGKTLRGIYELDDETFKVCFAPAGKDRPAEFATKEGDGYRLMTFKRQKP